MKGKHTLHNSTIVPSLLPKEGKQHQRNTGIDKRRDAMAHRYYFHATICRLLYEDCLLALYNEFFLQPETIVNELQLRLDLINELVQNQITTAELRRKYPFYNWVSKLL